MGSVAPRWHWAVGESWWSLKRITEPRLPASGKGKREECARSDLAVTAVDAVSLVGRALVGGILLVAGALKLLSIQETSRRFARAFHLPRLTVFIVAFIELTTGSGVVAGFLVPYDVVFAGCLFLTFAAMGFYAARSGRAHLRCGCYGQLLDVTVGPRLMLEDLALAAIAFLSSLSSPSAPVYLRLMLSSGLTVGWLVLQASLSLVHNGRPRMVSTR